MLKTISENNLVKKIKDLAADITGDAGIPLIREVSVVFSGPGGGGDFRSSGMRQIAECTSMGRGTTPWNDERGHGSPRLVRALPT